MLWRLVELLLLFALAPRAGLIAVIAPLGVTAVVFEGLLRLEREFELDELERDEFDEVTVLFVLVDFEVLVFELGRGAGAEATRASYCPPDAGRRSIRYVIVDFFEPSFVIQLMNSRSELKRRDVSLTSR